MNEPQRRRRRIRSPQPPAGSAAPPSTPAPSTSAPSTPPPSTPAPSTPAPSTSAPSTARGDGGPVDGGSGRNGAAGGGPAAVRDEPPTWTARVAEAEPGVGERGLRGLVGGGSSQISPAAAMRARDAARPRPEDLARAESDLTIIRRNWTPRE